MAIDNKLAMDSALEMRYHGLKLSFGTTDNSQHSKYCLLRQWAYDTSTDAIAHALIFPSADERLFMKLKLDNFDWKDADWLAVVVAESGEKTPLVFFVPKRLLETNGGQAATCIFWRYALDSEGSQPFNLGFKFLSSARPFLSTEWTHAYWQDFAQLRFKIFRLQACEKEEQGRTPNELFGKLVARDRATSSAVPPLTRSNNVQDLNTARKAETRTDNQPNLDGLRFKPLSGPGRVPITIAVHFRSEAWMRQARWNNVEESEDCPLRILSNRAAAAETILSDQANEQATSPKAVGESHGTGNETDVPSQPLSADDESPETRLDTDQEDDDETTYGEDHPMIDCLTDTEAYCPDNTASRRTSISSGSTVSDCDRPRLADTDLRPSQANFDEQPAFEVPDEVTTTAQVYDDGTGSPEETERGQKRRYSSAYCFMMSRIFEVEDDVEEIRTYLEDSPLGYHPDCVAARKLEAVDRFLVELRRFVSDDMSNVYEGRPDERVRDVQELRNKRQRLNL